jgi:ABC-type glycerol-3-phosphate transport system permease component
MGGDESRSTRVRWLNAVRYAIAVVVTVLTIGVIAWAIVQSLRPEVLYFSVAHGYVTIGKIKSVSPPVSLYMSVRLKANNHGGRAAIRYYNVSVHFLYNNSDSSEITYIKTDVIWVPPQFEYNDYISSSDIKAPGDVDMDFVRKMFKGYEIKNTTVRLDGRIQTQTSALNYTRGRFTMYHCYPVTIGTSSAHMEDDDVPCTVG